MTLTRTLRHLPAVVVALALGSGCATPPAVEPPSLVVVIAVDQLRQDYLERFDGYWEHGFRRLLDGGTVLTHARYAYLNTVTCAGHATIATGVDPATHGVILNAWYRRALGRQASCTFDERVTNVAYDQAPETETHSAHMLKAPTLGDRLRAQSPDSRVVTLSLKARSAIMLAGQGGTAVTWYADGWATSSAYASSPVPEVAAWIAAHPVSRDRGAVWDRVLPVDRYPSEDDAAGERPPNGWTRTFPHTLPGHDGEDAARFHDLWETSPFADAYLGAMAAGLVESMQLGRRGHIDYLGVSFSAFDILGHKFGPESHEVLDALVRLDRTIGALLDALDRAVGPDGYVLALSSDHGVAPIPEGRRAAGLDAGRLPTRQVGAAVDAALTPALGPGPHVARVDYSQVYLTDAAREALARHPDAAATTDAVLTAIRGVEGIAEAWSGADLAAGHAPDDPLARAAARSHHAGESGDFVAATRPYWFFVTGPTPQSGDGTTHGTAHDYDVAVPVIFYGAGIDARRDATPASPADIAPTLAARVGVAMPGVDGRDRLATPVPR